MFRKVYFKEGDHCIMWCKTIGHEQIDIEINCCLHSNALVTRPLSVLLSCQTCYMMLHVRFNVNVYEKVPLYYSLYENLSDGQKYFNID